MRTWIGWLLVALQAVLIVALVLVPKAELTAVRLVPGMALIAGGAILGIWAGRRLGNALTPTPVPLAGAALRTEGPYSRVRHPIYSAVVLAAIGFTVAVGTWWTALVLVMLVVFFLVKARWEDRLLQQVHGSDWDAWAARTGALLPRRVSRQ